MKRIVFLLFLFPTLAFTCSEHPKEVSHSPLWLKYLSKASTNHKHDHKHEKKKEVKKTGGKKSIKKADPKTGL